MNAISTLKEQYIRKETDSLGVVEVPWDKLWGAQTCIAAKSILQPKDSKLSSWEPHLQGIVFVR
jgi:aspartate ammonia-lyase